MAAREERIPRTTGGYEILHYILQKFGDAHLTMLFLRRIPEQSTNVQFPLPTWEAYVRQAAFRLLDEMIMKKSKKNPKYSFYMKFDARTNTGLALEIYVQGIKVARPCELQYKSEMKQFLADMSRTRGVDVLGGQDCSQSQYAFENTGEVQIEVLETGALHITGARCEELSYLRHIVLVSSPLMQDNSIIRLYAADGSFPSAFDPALRIPLNCFWTSIPLFRPQFPFQCRIMPSFLLPGARVKLMIATVVGLPEVKTGLMAFLCEHDVPEPLRKQNHVMVEIHPPIIQQRMLPIVPAIQHEAQEGCLQEAEATSLMPFLCEHNIPAHLCNHSHERVKIHPPIIHQQRMLPTVPATHHDTQEGFLQEAEATSLMPFLCEHNKPAHLCNHCHERVKIHPPIIHQQRMFPIVPATQHEAQEGFLQEAEATSLMPFLCEHNEPAHKCNHCHKGAKIRRPITHQQRMFPIVPATRHESQEGFLQEAEATSLMPFLCEHNEPAHLCNHCHEGAKIRRPTIQQRMLPIVPATQHEAQERFLQEAEANRLMPILCEHNIPAHLCSHSHEMVEIHPPIIQQKMLPIVPATQHEAREVFHQ